MDILLVTHGIESWWEGTDRRTSKPVENNENSVQRRNSSARSDILVTITKACHRTVAYVGEKQLSSKLLSKLWAVVEAVATQGAI